MRSVSFTLKTGLCAHDLKEFCDALRQVSLSSISYHVFDGRLRLGNGDNDFSRWIEGALGANALAAKLRALDPYTHTEEGLRGAMIAAIGRRLGE